MCQVAAALLCPHPFETGTRVSNAVHPAQHRKGSQSSFAAFAVWVRCSHCHGWSLAVSDGSMCQVAAVLPCPHPVETGTPALHAVCPAPHSKLGLLHVLYSMLFSLLGSDSGCERRAEAPGGSRTTLPSPF